MRITRAASFSFPRDNQMLESTAIIFLFLYLVAVIAIHIYNYLTRDDD